MKLDHALAPQQHQGQYALCGRLCAQCTVILGIDVPQRYPQLLAGHERLAVSPALAIRWAEQRHVLLGQISLHPRLAAPQRILPVGPLRMGAVFPPLDTHALPVIELAQGVCRRAITALLQAVTEREERAFELLSAQVVGE
ncbi:hypothetical protein D3C72_1906390 [compost metagenome]